MPDEIQPAATGHALPNERQPWGLHRPGPLDHPSKNRRAARLLADGNSVSETARQIGVARVTLEKWRQKDDAKKLIEDAAVKLLTQLDDAVDLSRQIIDKGRQEIDKVGTNRQIIDAEGAEKIEPVKYDVKIVELAQKSARDVIATAGILPSHTSSLVVTQMIVAPSEALSPVIARLLAPTAPISREIDVTPESIDDDIDWGE